MMNYNNVTGNEDHVLVSTISHELNTPLNAIIGFSDLILEEESIINIKDYASIIKQNGSLLLDKIRKVIDLSSMDYEHDIFLEEVHIHSVFIKVLKSIEQEIIDTNNGSTIYSNLTENSEAIVVYTDKAKLEKILTHLLLSTLHLKKSGKIYAGYQLIDKGTKMEKLQIFVSENKILGVDKPDEIESNTPKEKIIYKLPDGIGINMAICDKLSTKIDAKLHIDSTPFNNAIYFDLPVNTLLVTNLSSLNKRKFLIVEDEDICYNRLKKYLKKYSFFIIRTSISDFEKGIFGKMSDIDLIFISYKTCDKSILDNIIKIQNSFPKINFVLNASFFEDEIVKGLNTNKIWCIKNPLKRAQVEKIVDQYFNNSTKNN